MSQIATRLDKLKQLLPNSDFLANKGLSNEVGLYIFSYHPAEEMTVRHFIDEFQSKETCSNGEYRVVCFDLYDILLRICEERRILDRIPQMEEQRGQDFMIKQIQKLAPPEAYIRYMQYNDRQYGDVVFISGVGRVFPYMRSHNILNNLQHVFDGIPVVLFYPGEYSGQDLQLFGKIFDDNYYRAFNLIQ